MRKKYVNFLIKFLILFIVVELLLIMRLIVFSDDPLTWGQFLRGLPFMVIAGFAAIIGRSYIPPQKPKYRRRANTATKSKKEENKNRILSRSFTKP